MRRLPRSRLFYVGATLVYAVVVYIVTQLVFRSEQVARRETPPQSAVEVVAGLLPAHAVSFFIFVAFLVIAGLAAYRIAAQVTAALTIEERRAAELALVSGLGARLGAMRDPGEIGARATTAVRGVVRPGTTVGFISFDATAATFRVASEEGPRAGELSGKPYPADVLPEAVRAQVIANRSPLVLADTELEGPPWAALVRRFEDLATARTFAVIPLVSQDRLVGAMMLRDDAPNALAGGVFDLVSVLAHTVAAALANATSLAEAEARAEREALVNRIAQRSRESLDPNEVLRRAVEDIARSLGTSRALVCLGNSPDDLRVAQEYTAEGVTGLGRGSQHIPVPRLAVREGRTIVVHAVERDLRIANDADIADVIALGTRSVIAAPIGMRGQVVGALAVSQTDRERTWTADEVRLVEAVANELRTSMEAARLFQSRQRENERMLSLHHASAVLAGQTDPSVILEEVLKNAVRLLGQGSASLFVWVPEAKVLRNVRDYQVRGALRVLRPGEGVAGRAFERMAPVIVSDYQNWEGANDIAREAGQRAAIAVPLIRQGDPIGAIVVRSYDPAVRFTDEDGHLLTLFADQAVAALSAAEAFEQQRGAIEEAERLSKAKSDFISIVSHEFRTPLTGIMGFSEMMRDEDLSRDEIREYASDIHKDAHRLNRMITDMLDLDRMESGRMRLYRESTSLNAIVRDAADRFVPTADTHPIDLRLDPRLPDMWVDRDKITQVLANLLSNAVKYSPEGGTIVVSTRRTDDGAHVSVRDRGIGIPAEALESVFERYARVESGRTRYIQGTGLGLPIVRQIVDMHGGRVWVESAVGEGSDFQFTLPLASPPEPV
ncbi:MAG TPA: GAF domain-containing protein [Candidatus Limnocylindria bacterium]|nr:GAF domain-containing protein [Candidatus Limnocylindria bacterium]